MMREGSTTLTAIAVSVCVSLSVSTPVRCPHGAYLGYDKAGVGRLNVQPIVSRAAHGGRGDAAVCKCTRCRGRWYSVTFYPVGA